MVYADPALVSDGNSLYVANQVVEGLVGPDSPARSPTSIPVLAAAMPTVSADGKTYTFTLRTGVTFSDGTPFNADAVKSQLRPLEGLPKGDLQDNAYYYGAVFGGFGADSNIVSVDAPDDTTVVITLKSPQSNFLLARPCSVFGIQSPTALQAARTPTRRRWPTTSTPRPGRRDMVGTGPFMFKEWVPGDHITVVKNPNYWDAANAAHLDQITFKPIGDSTATLQALQSGGDRRGVLHLATDVRRRAERRPDDHRPRRLLQPGLPGHEPERRRAAADHLRQQGRPHGASPRRSTSRATSTPSTRATARSPRASCRPPRSASRPRPCRPTTSGRAKADPGRGQPDHGPAQASTSTTHPTSSGRTCPIRRTWPRPSPTT